MFHVFLLQGGRRLSMMTEGGGSANNLENVSVDFIFFKLYFHKRHGHYSALFSIGR